MKRYTIQTVTHLPILVEVERAKDADGRGYFLPGDRSEQSLFRVVKRADIKARFRTIFTAKEVPLFLGSVRIKQALDAGDEFELQRALDAVRPWVPDFADLKDRQWKSADGRVTIATRGMKRYSVQLNYSRLMADMFQEARLVMWFSEKEDRIIPAVYCPKWKTAAFVMTFAGRLRVCPKCNDIFSPKKNGKAGGYCSLAHGNAHRIQRKRWRDKQKNLARG